MSFSMHGVGVSGGIAIGNAHLISHAILEVPYYVLPSAQIPDEITRFETAITTTRNELEALRVNIPAGSPAEFSAFLGLHLLILGDNTLSRTPIDLIKSQRFNAEWALKQQMDTLLAQFGQIEDDYLRERKADVVQVVERVLKALLGHSSYMPPPVSAELGRILVAHDLSPADMMLFKQQPFAAFITDVGGATSHTAIVARSLNIPSIVALHHAHQLIRENELLIVDGQQGVVIVNPDRQILAEYKLRQSQWEIEKQKLKRLKSTAAATLDGTAVELHANIELPQDIPQVKASGATGIGLFRSEFLFLNRDDLPDEEEQFAAYRKVAQDMKGLPVTIRTLDLGADKQLRFADRSGDNPALGLRAIRLCLAEPQMFHTQLRAILRASHYGKVRLLIPMLSSLSELRQTLHLIGHAKQELAQESVPFDTLIPVGGMIEIPAAALSAQAFAKSLDFLSIGTNDLIQYTLAIDRTDDTVAHLYDPLHPAVLQLIAMSIAAADRAGIPVSVCGEMAGDAKLIRLLLGLGLRQFSMHPAHVLTVKQQILTSDLPHLTGVAQKMLKTYEPEKLHQLLARMNA
ncbi:MAG: phosphoenolpyruvate--protein phosphotransferase [Betaproteobacteria bacterium CG2_30_59_46]|nr:MAG: phosphoenolpyruvate--protein phosphotransferase [Betaproteobacteria bacterium CG2_30_59_46]PIQ10010.1 MAG: phosphoenolpyruvate--protein phosphotransferase [Hydrogenophilales bacterium CG18_big_fil_WC_8_21_14_2_50_58_12]PIY01317.1 MAG: phosphoenolpyruvate--protein phosphotransferase [Hydrogenophilales bacterium CG_4_10_14_3_um_filter_58_23]PJB06411.1 MAG: phosphoenolpyruvate--protein phosphotransferase [Hydrogenophilales bacterium CG_4_9_14_3_um_filter_59_35]